MVAVKAEKGESAENLIKRFSREVKKVDLMGILREKEFYKKPSEKRREAKQRRSATLRKLRREEEQAV